MKQFVKYLTILLATASSPLLAQPIRVDITNNSLGSIHVFAGEWKSMPSDEEIRDSAEGPLSLCSAVQAMIGKMCPGHDPFLANLVPNTGELSLEPGKMGLVIMYFGDMGEGGMHTVEGVKAFIAIPAGTTGPLKISFQILGLHHIDGVHLDANDQQVMRGLTYETFPLSGHTQASAAPVVSLTSDTEK